MSHLYVLVRRDLSAPQIAVQAAHAAIEAARRFLPTDHPHPHLVLCGVAHERALLAAADRLERAGVRFSLFREPDLNDAATALATEPLGSDRRRVLARHPCLTRADLFLAPAARGSGAGVSSEDNPVT
ncbi:MAG: hypothetical protein K2V38_27825 [Gemmataceae bacterium]|nr:hypothetical protein [Gemmataceae bacterium]